MLVWLGLILTTATTIAAIARPAARTSLRRTAGVDLVVLQDGSASMRVKDVSGDRWQRSMRFLRVMGESLEVVTLMGPFVAEPGKAWLLKRRGLQTADAFGGVLGEYLLYSVLAAWMCGLSFILIPAGALPDAMRRAVAIYIAVVASVTTALAYALLTGTGPVAALLRRLHAPQRLVSPIADGEAVITRLLRSQPRRVVFAIAAQTAAHLLLAFEAWLVFRAIGSPIPALSSVAFEGAAKLVDVAFFFVPGHLGAQEGFYEMVAPALGAVPAAGLTLALLRRMRGLVVAVAGLALLARWDGAARRE